ncbi:hypothetical protein EV363DRAFT_842593 [Boletus edulis]|nr:hypothetical protein EV363DRAFT_842593 [Boletus edulis]
MPRHRRSSNDPTPKSSGLLSHVFSFVSREFESFVVNATARPANQPAPTGRVKRRGRDSERNMSEDEARCRSRAQHRRERERRSKPEPSRRKPRSKSTDTTRKYRHNHVQPTDIDDDRGGAVSRMPFFFLGVVELVCLVLSASDRERSKSPAPQRSTVFPVPPPPKLKKQPSITMPGSLFPRSPSLVPDKPDMYQYTSSGPISIHRSHPPCDSDLDGAEAGPSRTHSSTVPSADSVDPNQPSLDQYVSPWRTRSVASVHDAVHRFNVTDGVEADFSLMLPSPLSSPAKPISKTRSVDETSPNRPTLNPAPLPTTSRKGKERARASRDEDDLDFIVCGSSGHDVHAKERELDAAREAQREHERLLGGDQGRRASDERERDKRRIKALEEEVRGLKEQV